jgi:hypothetical protein
MAQDRFAEAHRREVPGWGCKQSLQLLSKAFWPSVGKEECSFWTGQGTRLGEGQGRAAVGRCAEPVCIVGSWAQKPL